MENSTCVAWVHPTMYAIGKLLKHRCGKVAVGEDLNGRILCREHLKRWKKKVGAVSFNPIEHENMK